MKITTPAIAPSWLIKVNHFNTTTAEDPQQLHAPTAYFLKRLFLYNVWGLQERGVKA